MPLLVVFSSATRLKALLTDLLQELLPEHGTRVWADGLRCGREQLAAPLPCEADLVQSRWQLSCVHD